MEQSNQPINGWQTNVGASVAGVVASLAITRLFNLILDIVAKGGDAYTYETTSKFIVACQVGLLIFYIYYAASMYPDYFHSGNKANFNKHHNSFNVSFVNCFVGGIIFGPLWNSNMTKGIKGYSNVVYVVLCCIGAALLAWSIYTLYFS